jgi:lipoprotein-releasing system permease protein
VLPWLIFRNYLLSRRSGALVRIIAWHCVIGIGMGVAALLIVLSVMNGFNLTIRSRMLSVDPHLVIVEKRHPSDDRAEAIRREVEKFSRSGVVAVERFETQDLIVRSVDGVFGGVVARGYDEQAMNEMLKRVWSSLRRETAPPLQETGDLGPSEIVLGIDLARGLGIFEGDEVIVVPPEALLLPKGEAPKFQKFRVKALLNTQMPEFDSKLMFYNLDRMPERLRSVSREQGYEVRLVDPYEADRVKRGLQALKIESQTWGERETSLFFALKLESMAMALFLLLAVLITSFSIVTVMVLLMSQKRRDIGMFMALGLSLRRTRLVFLQVGLLLSYVGIIGGVLIGGSVCLFLDWYPLELLPDIYTDSTLPAKLTPRILLFVVGSSSVIAVLGAWLPIWRYVLPSPSESLRKAAGAAG